MTLKEECLVRGLKMRLNENAVERAALEKLLTSVNQAAVGAVTAIKKNPKRRKLHWTQRPENKAKLRAVIRKMVAKKAEKKQEAAA